MNNEFKNKVVVISGGASGIGFATAKAFANLGATIILCGRKKSKLQSAQTELAKITKCFTEVVDVSNSLKVKKVVNNILKKHKKIDCLINCAGVLGPVGETGSVSMTEFAKAVSINLLGTAFMSSAVLPHMAKRKQGKIVNMSGGGAVGPRPNFSAYAASKAAVVRLTENLAEEYKGYNVQINSVAPGAINTKFLEETIKAGKKAGKKEYQSALKQKQSGGDSAELAAEAIVFLCSEKSKKISGKLISAKWDPWKELTEESVNKINKNSEYALRRIDNKYFYEKQ